MIILSAFLFITTLHDELYIVHHVAWRFALHFAFASNMSKICGICHLVIYHPMFNGQWSIFNALCGNPRAWTSVPGRFPSFLWRLHETESCSTFPRAQMCEPRSTDSHVIFLFVLACRLWLTPSSKHSRKEVFQPHLPVRLPCYDLAPITSFALGRSSR